MSRAQSSFVSGHPEEKEKGEFIESIQSDCIGAALGRPNRSGNLGRLEYQTAGHGADAPVYLRRGRASSAVDL